MCIPGWYFKKFDENIKVGTLGENFYFAEKWSWIKYINNTKNAEG